MGWMKDETGLEKRPANFVPLTPLSHLIRAARVFPERTAWSTAPSARPMPSITPASRNWPRPLRNAA
jgi:hypothetical protein